MKARPLEIKMLRQRPEIDRGGATFTLKKSDGKMGIKPVALRRGPIEIKEVEDKTWAARNGFLVGAKITALGRKPLETYKSKEEVMAAMKIRPLEVTVDRVHNEDHELICTRTVQKADGDMGFHVQEIDPPHPIVVLAPQCGKLRNFTGIFLQEFHRNFTEIWKDEECEYFKKSVHNISVRNHSIVNTYEIP